MIPIALQHQFDEIEALAETNPQAALNHIATLPKELRATEFATLLAWNAHMHVPDVVSALQVLLDGPQTESVVGRMVLTLSKTGLHVPACSVLTAKYPIKLEPWEVLVMVATCAAWTDKDWTRQALRTALIQCPCPEALVEHIFEDHEVLVPLLLEIQSEPKGGKQ
jgi:hypothetical protein